MTDRHEHSEKAIAAVSAFDASSVDAGFAEITYSPLGRLIESLLPTVPRGRTRTILERIRNLKQGKFEDLSDPEFKSFLVSYLRIDVSKLEALTRILRSHEAVHTQHGANLQVAARGASGCSISDVELETLLARRKLVD